jgi:hypothetical protein
MYSEKSQISFIPVEETLFTNQNITYLDIDSSNCCSESWKRAATVGVRGFIVTNRPLALLIVFAVS